MKNDFKEIKYNNEFIQKLIEFNNLIDINLKESIKLPRICSLGTISSGKSSVLESILGLGFFPIGDGVVTRRPLEVNLYHINSGEPYAIFEERESIIYKDFNKVREAIEELTEEVICCRRGYEYEYIIDRPIILNIYSKICPNITLIDLPGVESKSYMNKYYYNRENFSQFMARRYIEDPLTIILCVIPGNSDISSDYGLQLAKEVDPTGSGTLGILTKIDIMDIGTDVKRELLNETIPFKNGFIGVKNRCKYDLKNKLSLDEAFKREKEFFKSNPLYRKLPDGYLGNEALINKLTKIYLKLIKENLINNLKEKNNIIKEKKEEYYKDEINNKTELLNIINKYSDI